MSADGSFRVADRERFGRLLDDMARRIVALGEDDLELLGVRRRGVPLAERLADRLGEEQGRDVPVQEIVLKRYADDLTLLHDRPELEEEPELDVAGKSVLVVDDVLYTGRTLFRAAQIAVAAGADRVRAAVLCSRGTNDVPVTAVVTGLQLDVGESGVVEVHVPPYEEVPGIRLVRKPD